MDEIIKIFRIDILYLKDFNNDSYILQKLQQERTCKGVSKKKKKGQ